MKDRTALILAFAVVAAGCSSSDSVAPLTCGIPALKGAYGVQRNGQVGPGARIAAVGVANFDGNGRLSGKETLSLNGVFSPVTLSGSYSLDADCTGTESDVSGNVIANLAMVHGGDELFGESLVPGSNVAFHYVRITGPCSNATLNGRYSFQRNGQNAAGATLLATGTIVFDGQGNQTVRQTIDRGGTFTTVDQVGFYLVNSDCTGTQSDNRDNTGVFSQLVIVHDADQVLGISQTPGNTIVVHYEKN